MDIEWCGLLLQCLGVFCFAFRFWGERKRGGWGGGGWVCMWLFAINYFLIYTKKQSIFCYSLQLYKKLKHLFFENA